MEIKKKCDACGKLCWNLGVFNSLREIEYNFSDILVCKDCSNKYEELQKKMSKEHQSKSIEKKLREEIKRIKRRNKEFRLRWKKDIGLQLDAYYS